MRWWLASCHSWLWGLVAGPRHSWLGSAAGCCGRSLGTPGLWPWAWFPATPGWGPLVVVVGALGALLLGLGVCVSAVWPFVLVWVARGGWCALWPPCVCVCVLAVCGWWGVTYLGWFSSSVGMVVFKKQKKKSNRRGPVDVQQKRVVCVTRNTYVSICPTVLSSPVVRERVQVFGGSVGCFCVLCLVPSFFVIFRSVFDNIPPCLAFPL